jgi:hypothetical protein
MQQILQSGGAGLTIIFLAALAGIGVVGSIWLTYACHCFLVVLTESSAGEDEIRWPDEIITEWWWKPLYCVGLLLFWVMFGGIFLWPAAFAGPWVLAAVGALFLWYGYPVGLLCVMDARSALAVIHVPLLTRLVRHLPAVFLAGLIALPLAAAAAALLVAAVLKSVFWAVPAAILFPPALLFYGRCWGRLAWLLLNIRKRVRRPATEAPPPGTARVTVSDPWALPPEEPLPEFDAEALVEPEPLAPGPGPDEEWAENPAPYGVAVPNIASTSSAEGAVGEGQPADSGQFSHARYYEDYRKKEEERKARAEGRKPQAPRHRRATVGTAFGKGLFLFFLDGRVGRAWINLGAATLGLLILLRIAFLTLPVGS